jgi:hypothetical protein
VGRWFRGTSASLIEAAPASSKVGSQGTGAIASDELGASASLLGAVPVSPSVIPLASALAPLPVSFKRPPQPRTATSPTESVVHLMSGSPSQDSGHCNFAKSGSTPMCKPVSTAAATIDLSWETRSSKGGKKSKDPTREVSRKGTLPPQALHLERQEG